MDHSVSLNFSQLSQEHITKLKDAFQMIDADGDGIISKTDLQEMLASMGKQNSDEVIEQMLSSKGSSTDGLNFPEFLSLMSGLSGEFPEEDELKQCLRNLADEQGSLNVPLDDLLQSLKDAGFANPEEKFAKIFKTFGSTQKTTSTKIFKGESFLATISDS
ncbi:similar to Saccharomyces cerevisiae YPR188C MLC2 Regulatory light chain for the type II myosin, Myo1p [Maudiozyma saulgeensis]|uniref:Similar to Saccharomyces cerevisiae YPR188C MLC2 Regulatory light chain for the type II myosin, Myo1p n=1 Tax=Maudiozyma saulgeensis TaxID=1789683 RepID=A0A1X7RB33_9SACH|nr:similar to Saccharomyces cerevisiae YPR188C MLC2 Regulatory light chain for the type II myosin, Myo1p [Kazachstania saulgeensis]